MGLFGPNSPFDADIEKATSEKNTTEPWNLIMDICDKITSNPKNARECLRIILRRVGNADPHIALQAITLLDACVKNCGKQFHLEVASREFENEYRKLLAKAPTAVSLKMRQIIKKWKDNEFKSDPQLSLIPSFYQKLKQEGHDFTEQKTPKPSAVQAAALKDPNVVTSQQEEEDIAKAIELSLKETKNSPKKQTASTTSSSGSTYPSLYPSFSNLTAGSSNGVASSAPANVEPRKVRALYDFEAAEENELTFCKGEIIHVLDDSDPNWWKGYNQRGQGLFPSNFVTADLSVEPDQLDINQQQKSKKVQFEDEMNGSPNSSKKDEKTDLLATDLENLTIQAEINEEKIDRLLHLLHEANPEDPTKDTNEMLRLEDEVNQMGPLIDAELELVDRKHAQLTQLSSDLVDAINLYHTLMREPPISSPAHMSYFANPMAANLYGQPQPNLYNPTQAMAMPFGMQQMYQMPGNVGVNQNMSMPTMQHMSQPNMGPNSMPSMMSTNPQQMHANMATAIYDNSNMNNHQMQQMPPNQHPIGVAPYQNDQQHQNAMQNSQQMPALQQIHQAAAMPQQIPNTQTMGQQNYIQAGGPPIAGMSQQQIMPASQVQHNNMLQQNQQQQQQQHPQMSGVLGGNMQLNQQLQMGNSMQAIPASQNVMQHSNGMPQMPLGNLNHVNNHPNLNNSVISNAQLQHAVQASSISSNMMSNLTQPTQFPIGMNQSLSQSMLGQNDVKPNIPIYQQR